MRTQTHALQRAIDYLGAVEVAPGRYAWLRYESDAYFVGDVKAVLNNDLRKPANDPGTVTMMPSWWTPTMAYAIVSLLDDEHPNPVAYATLAEARHDLPHFDPGCRIITVDLETGAEVPA